MNKRAIIIVADNNYLEQAKSLAVNCVEQGGWKEDFAVICPTNTEAAAEFRAWGFHVLETSLKGFLQKFEVFNPFFEQWEQVLYLDCDILVQDDLERLFSLLDVEDKIWMDTEDGKIIDMFWRDENKAGNNHIYNWMATTYPHVYTHQTFNSAFMLFRPSFIEDGTVERLVDVQSVIHEANNPDKMGTDQQPVNLVMWNKAKKIPHKLVCFWGLAEPVNDVDSEWRQYKKGDIPVAIHYTRWYAPWIKKTPDADAYDIDKLDRVCYELYHENLSKFKKVFSNGRNV